MLQITIEVVAFAVIVALALMARHLLSTPAARPSDDPRSKWY